MKFNLCNPLDVSRFKKRCEKLLENAKGKSVLSVELTEKTKGSLSQNNYLHILLTQVAIEFGCSMDYIKQEVFKKLICPEIFRVDTTLKTGHEITEFRSWATVQKEQRTIAVNKLISWAAMEHDIHLPEPHETEILRAMEIEHERMKERYAI